VIPAVVPDLQEQYAVQVGQRLISKRSAK
jgi:hypothetical protein